MQLYVKTRSISYGVARNTRERMFYRRSISNTNQIALMYGSQLMPGEENILSCDLRTVT